MDTRRNFLIKALSATGSLILGVEAGTKAGISIIKTLEDAALFNAYLTVYPNGKITIFSPNPEIGQGIKTAFAVIVAEELDVDVRSVEVVQANFDPKRFDRQETGGSGAIKHSWERLRKAGASARYALIEAAAKRWGVGSEGLKTHNGTVIGPRQSASYGELASLASTIKIPDAVPLKSSESFTQIGTFVRSVDNQDVLTGRAIYGIDYREDEMVYAQLIRPPFGKKLKGFDATEAKKVEGILDVITLKDKIAVIGSGNWPIIKARKLITVEWVAPKPTESDKVHNQTFDEIAQKGKFEVKRKDGDVEKAFKEAHQIVEATYQCPFLPHNAMEPLNFFADARDLNRVRLVGATQTPARTLTQLDKMFGIKPQNVSVNLTKMGGAFGRRIATDFTIEAVELSIVLQKPVKLTYTREDDMTAGYYRPAVRYTFKASLDKSGNITGYMLRGIGMNWNNVVKENNFPVGAIDNVLIENYEHKSDVTTGFWRAPVTNFLAFAEQAFLDEVAEKASKDPVALRLELLQKAKHNPVGNISYDPERFEEVIKKVTEISRWGKPAKGIYQGFSVYFSHNSYVAQVAEVVRTKGKPALKKVYAASDCGIVINRSSAENQVYGSIVDGIGHALFGKLNIEDGQPTENNFNTFRLIRNGEAPAIEAVFINNGKSPTGLGEPALPPVGGALANALAKATRKRLYRQPFVEQDSQLLNVL